MSWTLPNNFLLDVYRSQPTDPALAIEHALAEALDDLGIVGADQLNLGQFRKLDLCTTQLQDQPRPVFTRYWGGEDSDMLHYDFEQALWEVGWRDSTLHVLEASWPSSCGRSSRRWVIAATTALASEFILEVARKTNDPGDAMLVFNDGHWSRSSELYQVVQSSSFDDLILNEDLKQSIRSDFRLFLTAREQYAELGLAWRRGALLIGPPGNGKTHCVRALVKELGVPSLYVQSLQHRYYQSEQLLRKVFDRARELRPSILIFEDLDALIDRSNQSFFLNQLDGFEKNEGLLVLATTNHPERIDPAIIDRPSRFDRKYHFHLPTRDRRLEFFLNWRERLATQVEWTEASIVEQADATDGFSFAYLKELVVSGLLNWVADRSVPFERGLEKQRTLLAGQMRTASSSENDTAKDSADPGVAAEFFAESP